MFKSHPVSLVQCGCEITPEEIEQIQETVEVFWRLSRSELTRSICEHLEMIFVKPLVKDFRRRLVSGALVGRVEP